MKTIARINEELASTAEKVGKIRAACVQQNREMDQAEQVQVKALLGEIDGLNDLKKLEERTQLTITNLNASTGDVDRTVIDHTHVDSREGDKFGNSAEFFQAVMRANVPGGITDPRLSTRAAEGLSEGVPSDGGFLVQTDVSTEIMKTVWEDSAIPSRIRKFTLSGNSNGIKINGMDETSRVDGSRAGGIRAYWKDEAALKTKSKPSFRKIELAVNKLIGLCYATDELLSDASALDAIIRTGFQQEFNFKITDAIINGSGVGQPLGILNAGSIVSVTKETGQDKDTIVYQNVNKMWSRLLASSRPNAIWIINQDCETQLNEMSVAVGTGGVPVYMPAGGAAAQPYSTLFGRPVLAIEQCATLGDTGDIMLCDFAGGYVGCDKGGMVGDVSMHVQFIYDEQVFRFVYRFDGQPVLGSAITPYKGNDTLSHFVKLNERT